MTDERSKRARQPRSASPSHADKWSVLSDANGNPTGTLKGYFRGIRTRATLDQKGRRNQARGKVEYAFFCDHVYGLALMEFAL